MYQMQNKIVSAMYFLKTIVKEYHHKLVRYQFFFVGGVIKLNLYFCIISEET